MRKNIVKMTLHENKNSAQKFFLSRCVYCVLSVCKPTTYFLMSTSQGPSEWGGGERVVELLLRRNRSKTFPLYALNCYLPHPPIPGFSDLPTFIPGNARSIQDATGIHGITLYMFSNLDFIFASQNLKF